MPPIYQTKRQKISEQIIHHLFTIAPEPIFTNKNSPRTRPRRRIHKNPSTRVRKKQNRRQNKKIPHWKRILKKSSLEAHQQGLRSI